MSLRDAVWRRRETPPEATKPLPGFMFRTSAINVTQELGIQYQGCDPAMPGCVMCLHVRDAEGQWVELHLSLREVEWIVAVSRQSRDHFLSRKDKGQ